MRKFYFVPLLLFFSIRSAAQSCSALAFTYTSAESRCVATGSLTVNVTGGSGSYTYKAVGPVVTPSTSSNVITGLAPGYYSIFVKDVTTGCIAQVDSAQVLGSYDDPRFQLTKTDAGCAGNDGTISVLNQQFGRAPFSYTIIAPSPSQVGASNSTGSFSGLSAGEYVIQLQDSCGGIQVRRITLENYTWWFDSVSVVKTGCDNVNVFIRVKDNKGNVNTIGTAFNGFSYGYVIDGDTTWNSANSFSVFIGKRRSLTLVVKDNCGTIHSSIWNIPANQIPTVGSVGLSNLNCATFTATLSGSNLTNPQYCIYQNSVQLACNSTGVFNNLLYGSYCIEMKDLCYDTVITRCFTANQPLPAVGATVSITNKNCTGFTATITGQQNLYTPQYCLYDSNSVVVACNATGVFNNVPYGSYCIETHDACTDSLIRRCFTVAKPVALLSGVTISGANCNSFNASASGSGLISPTYCLYDSLGNVIACNSTGIFNGLGYGNYCIRAISCSDTTNSVCFSPAGPTPAVGTVAITNKQCLTFTASLTGQVNLTNPQFCLYDAADSLLACNTTGVFDSLAYGSYCIKMHDGCSDTTITRCFSQTRAIPSINSTIQLLSSTCSTISIKVNGTNLTSPTYCLYNASNTLVTCNTTGTFNNIPYGQYCVEVEDGCVDTTMRVCKTFTPTHAMTLTASKSCTIGNTYVNVDFSNGNAPFFVRIYNPSGSLAYSVTTSTIPLHIELPALAGTGQYKVIGIDNCGNSDTAFITPNANIVTKAASVRAKCPSAVWLNGAGDIVTTITTNYFTVLPQIIKKNGASFVQSFSSVASNVYTFSDLEPATYIVEYTQQTCNTKIYDTVTVPPYVYPSQGESAIYQCDNNSFSLGANVEGGVSPFTFQIIGSTPSSPSITTSPQSSPIFNINTGTTYSLVRLRSVDACGNATLADVSVLPLQNISIAATNTCFYQNITLSVDTVVNASYTWYRKNTPTDSVLIGSGTSYNLPFFVPEQIGQYICKMVINGGCVTRLASFTLDGNCGNIYLNAHVKLIGKKEGNTNQLHWSNADETGLVKYVVERKRVNDANYSAIGNVEVHQGKNYLFNDQKPGAGVSQYRLKLVYANKNEYTNVVNLTAAFQDILVYPNPAKDRINISINGDRASQYKIELLNTNGGIVYSTEIKNTISTTITYTRKNLPAGIYLIRIKNIDANTTEIRKLLFE